MAVMELESDLKINTKVDASGLRELRAELESTTRAYEAALAAGNETAMKRLTKTKTALTKQIKEAAKELSAAKIAEASAAISSAGGVPTKMDIGSDARKKVQSAILRVGADPAKKQLRYLMKNGITTMVAAQGVGRTARYINKMNSGDAAAMMSGLESYESEQTRNVLQILANEERRKLKFADLKKAYKEFDELPDGWRKKSLGKHLATIASNMIADNRYKKSTKDKIAKIGEDVNSQLKLMKDDGASKSSGLSKTASVINTVADTIWTGNGRSPVTNLYNAAIGKGSSWAGAGLGLAVGGLPGAIVGAGIGAVVGAITNLVHKTWRMTADRSFTIRDRRALLGDAYNHNFTENMAEMYRINEGSLLSMTENARYFKTRAAFGQVSENEMMGSMLLPNFHNAMMNGGGTSDLVAALQRDMAEGGQDRVWMGLKMKGLPTDLMSLEGASFDRAIKGTQEQEAEDIRNIRSIIESWASRAGVDLSGMRFGVNATYGPDWQKTQARIQSLFRTDLNTRFGVKNERPIILENTTNVNIDGTNISQTREEKRINSLWAGMSSPAR